MSEDSYLREERRRAKEIDSLSDAAKKAINPYLNKAVNGFLAAIKEKVNQIKNVKKEDYGSVFPVETADAVAATAEGYVHSVEQLIASSYMLGMIHADEDKPRKDKSFTAADEAPEEIPAITFEKAKEFLSSKIPMTKSEWLKLEPKLRFRAFTVAKLGQAELIDRVKKELVKSLQSGTGVAQTWDEFKKLAEKSIDNFSPWYWETVFRTNTQSAYVAGKLQRYEGTGAKAYQLMVIDDSGTTDICRNLLRQSGYGMVLPVDHDFWKKYGFPPYHFNCRTSIRAVYSSQKGPYKEKIDNPGMKEFKTFKPQEGFGGNPVDNGNWWMLTQGQMEQAIKYGVLREFNRDENIFADYDSVWKGYKRHEGKNGGWYDLCENPPNDWEKGKHPNKPIVEFLAENGYKIKVVPDLKNIKSEFNVLWSNPDIILDGILFDIKEIDSLTSSAVKSRIKSAWEKQRLNHVVLNIPDEISVDEIEKGFKRFAGEKHSVTMNVLWIYKGKINKTVI